MYRKVLVASCNYNQQTGEVEFINYNNIINKGNKKVKSFWNEMYLMR